MGTKTYSKSDVETIVREHFQQYVGETDEDSLADHVIAEAGVDSILLVMILTDLFVQVDLDVGDAEVKLVNIKTLGDVAILVETMLAKSAASDGQ
jgi:acyl carrier protein